MKSKLLVKVAAIASLVTFGFLFGIMYMQYSGNWPTGASSLPRDTDLASYEMELPDWSFTLSNETSLNLHDLRGQTLVIELMATWCSACKTQIPFFEELVSLRGDDIRIIALSIDSGETPGMMANYKVDEGFEWECGTESSDSFSEYLNVSLIPTILIIDPEGLLRWMHEGTWGSTSMNSTLTSLGI
jgi:thiol-disulfide isomerase/thioredoxin